MEWAVLPQKEYIRRYTTISAVINLLRRRELALLDPATWDDRNDRYFMDLYKEQRGVIGLYALCAATCNETYHHWRVFTGAADGACVEIKRAPLERALSRLGNIRCEEIDYLKLEEVDALSAADVMRLPFVKRYAFKPEDEYRIIAETHDPQASAMGIRLPISWISKITLNPWLPGPLAESVIQTLHTIPYCKKLVVQRSHLIDNARWKRAGDRIVGKRPPRKSRVHIAKGK